MILSLRDASHQNDTQSQVIANVGLALAEAIVDFHAGHFEDSFKRLAPVRYNVIAIGGSHAQRDLFAQLLIESALLSKRADDARALLAERTRLKPENPHTWRRYADALELAGDHSAAINAREHSKQLLSE